VIRRSRVSQLFRIRAMTRSFTRVCQALRLITWYQREMGSGQTGTPCDALAPCQIYRLMSGKGPRNREICAALSDKTSDFTFLCRGFIFGLHVNTAWQICNIFSEILAGDALLYCICTYAAVAWFGTISRRRNPWIQFSRVGHFGRWRYHGRVCAAVGHSVVN